MQHIHHTGLEQRTILVAAKIIHFTHLSISLQSHKIFYLHACKLQHSQHMSQPFLFPFLALVSSPHPNPLLFVLRSVHISSWTCKIWGSNNGAAKDSSLLGCSGMSTGKQLILKSHSTTLLGLIDPDDEGTVITKNIRCNNQNIWILQYWKS